MKKINKKEIFVIFCVIAFIIFEQLTKIFLAKDIMLLNGIIKFTNVQNTGGAFGIFNTSIITVILLNLIIIAMIVRFLIIKRDYMSKIVYRSLILIVAGGTSNLIDRIFRGHVVDFIDITQLFNFPVFNIADIVIVVGWFLLIIGVVNDLKINKQN